MSKKAVMERLSFYIPKNNTLRLKVSYDPTGQMQIRIDVHGYTVSNTRILIKNIIGLLQNVTFTLGVVHGYHHGDSIKHMIHEEELSKRITNRWVSKENPGISYLLVT